MTANTGRGDYIQLLHTYKDQPIGGWMVSEKLDGMAAFWDGGVSRGHAQAEISWANRYKNERYVKEPICTGLWSRYGNVIPAPDWWLDEMPTEYLLGELYAGIGHRQDLLSVLKGQGDWSPVRMHVTERIPPAVFNQPRTIRLDTKYKWEMHGELPIREGDRHGLGIFKTNYTILKSMDLGGVCSLVEQTELPRVGVDLTDRLAEVLAKGGEGLVVRDPFGIYTNKRTASVLKIKDCLDAEGTIIGYTDGKDRNEGRVGAFVLQVAAGALGEGSAPFKMELSGMSDALRDSPPPVGTVVTFKYRCLTKAGIPQEARYWRQQ